MWFAKGKSRITGAASNSLQIRGFQREKPAICDILKPVQGREFVVRGSRNGAKRPAKTADLTFGEIALRCHGQRSRRRRKAQHTYAKAQGDKANPLPPTRNAELGHLNGNDTVDGRE